MNDTFSIQLPIFQGPFDLLLFFIERDELDIYNIPIHKISTDFLAYIRQLQDMNINVASEFIYVASSLMKIKSKMLIPRKELDESGNEVDPRLELVQRILEYKQYKQVLEELQALELSQSGRHERPSCKEELKYISEKFLSETEIESVTLYKLMKVFGKLMDNYEYRNKKMNHQVVQYNWTIESTKEWLKDLVSQEKRLDFIKLFAHCSSRIHALFIFLSILELVQTNDIVLEVGTVYNQLWLSIAA